MAITLTNPESTTHTILTHAIIRRTAGGHGGWYQVLWGAIWFVGFLTNQFLSSHIIAGWLWVGLDTIGIAGSVWLTLRTIRRGEVRSTIWRLILAWWLALTVFYGVLYWRFDLDPSGNDPTLLLILTIALGYFMIGLFTSWRISAVGALIAALAVGADVLLPDYFNLAMAFLGGGLLLGSGLWFVRGE